MALSWEEFTATAGQETVPVNIAYLDKSDIYVELNDVDVTGLTWDSDTLIRLPSTLKVDAGDKLAIIRRTDRSVLRLLFSEGAAFTRDNLDEQNDQFLYLAQELVEGRSIDGFYGTLSMNGYRIVQVGNPVDAGDASNKGYVDTEVAQAASDSTFALNEAIGKVVRIGSGYLNPIKGDIKNKLLGFDSAGQPYGITASSGSSLELAEALASPDTNKGASLVSLEGGESVQEFVDSLSTEVGDIQQKPRVGFDVIPSPLEPWPSVGVAFGKDRVAELLVDAEGRIRVDHYTNGGLTGRMMYPTVEGYGTQVGKYPDKIVKFPSVGLEGDTASPALIFSSDTNGAPRIIAISPKQYGQYAWPEKGTNYDGPLLVAGEGTIYRELVWTDNVRALALGSYAPVSLSRNNTTAVEYVPICTWDVSGGTPWGGDLLFSIITSKTDTYVPTTIRCKANLQLLSGMDLANISAMQWSRIIESTFDGPFNMLRSQDGQGAYYDVVGLGITIASGIVTLYLTLPTSGSQSNIRIIPEFLGNSSKMNFGLGSLVSTQPTGFINLPHSMSWGGANSGRAADGSVVASDIHVRVYNSNSDFSGRPDISADGYTQVGFGYARSDYKSSISVARNGVGTYTVNGLTSAWNGWRTRPLYGSNGSELGIIVLDTSVTGTVVVKVYTVLYKTAVVGAGTASETVTVTKTTGDLMDIPVSTWVDLNGVN